MQNTEDRIQKTENGIDRKTALKMSEKKGAEIYELFALSNRIREKFRGNKIDLCSIINAKSGACPEDCSFCAQSAHSKTNINVHPLMDKEKILDAATSAKKFGSRRCCIVTSMKLGDGIGRNMYIYF
jgi:biotin synthase